MDEKFYKWRRGEETFLDFLRRISPKGTKVDESYCASETRFTFDFEHCVKEYALAFIKKLNKDMFSGIYDTRKIYNFSESKFIEEYENGNAIFVQIENDEEVESDRDQYMRFCLCGGFYVDPRTEERWDRGDFY